MSKKPIQVFTNLTIIKPDLIKLIDIFQRNLQDVEITIDDQPLYDDQQLEHFAMTYQASSLLVRGYWSEKIDKNVNSHNDRQVVELKANRRVATLLIWTEDEKEESEVLDAVKNVLLHCQKRRSQSFRFFSFLLLCTSFAPLQEVSRDHNFSFVSQFFFEVGGGLLLAAVALFLWGTTVRFLKLDTGIFLFPGAREALRAWGKREAVGTVIVAFLVQIIIILLVGIVFSLVWK